jgi:peroxiredoxin
MKIQLTILLSLFAFINLDAQDAVEYTTMYNEDVVQVGDQVPAFSGVDLAGNELNSESILQEQELVLIFYRGVWCPKCMKHLERLQDSLSYIEKTGAKLVVVTPEQPEFIKQTVGKTDAAFSILSDEEYQIMSDYGVAFRISDETLPKYVEWTRNKTRKANGNEDDILPVPATFVIGQDGKLKWKHFDPNYSNRASVASIISALDE